MADDPYRAPTEAELPRGYPATACPACEAPVTFLRSCLQLNPARFRCPACKACFGYHLPQLGYVLVALIPCTVVVSLVTMVPGREVGWPILAPALGVGAFLWVVLRLLYVLERRYARLFDLTDAETVGGEAQA